MASEETQSDLAKAFKGVKLEDISVKPDSRIEIKNPEIAARLSELAVGQARAAGNEGCHNSGCGSTGSNTGCTNVSCQ
jgi:hypothetical protein